MTDVLGPADAGAVNTLTTTTDVTNPTAGDTWFQDCVANNPATGTNLPSRFMNRLLQSVRRIIRLSGVPQSNSDDDMFGQAIQSGALNWAATFGGTADALTATLSPAPLLLISGMRIGGIAVNPNATTSPTLNVAGLGGVAIIAHGGDAVAAGDVTGLMQFEYDGTSWRIAGLAASDIAATTIGLENIVQITGTGAHPYTPSSPNVRALRIRGQAPGGGGGSTSSPSTGQASVGLSGSGGGYAEKYVLTAGLTFPATVTIGAPGSAGTAGSGGGAGGTTSFVCTGMTSIVCTGGNGGLHGGVSTTFPGFGAGTSGGSASGGDININGGPAQSAILLSASALTTGQSGGSQLGTPGLQEGVGSNGAPGTGFGSGGSGGCAPGPSGAFSGAAGSPGIFIVTELF